MLETLSSLDWELAWRRVKADIISGRVFAVRPFEVALIEVDLKGWLDSLADDVRERRYAPDATSLCQVPKIQGPPRMVGLLTMRDRVVYAACVGACLRAILSVLSRPGDVNAAIELTTDPRDVRWVERKRISLHYKKAARERIQAGTYYIAKGDIQGYGDNIGHETLLSQLREIGAPADAIDQIGVCLARWTSTPGRGIPQGLTTSDVLAELYHNPIDRCLQSVGYKHYRWSDEFRISCRSRSEAKKALAELSRLLWQRGLKLQEWKSGIRKSSVVALAAFVERGKNILPAPARTAIAGLWLLLNRRWHYTRHFRHILRVLHATGDPRAIGACPSLLVKYPYAGTTRDILSYCMAAGGPAAAERVIMAFLNSGAAVPAYQLYIILDWLDQQSVALSETLLPVLRRLALDEKQPGYLRSRSWKLLGAHGSEADLELLKRIYFGTSDELERGEIICCLLQRGTDDREAFLQSAELTGAFAQRAVRLIREQSR